MRFVHYYPNAMGDSGVTLAMWSWARAIADAGFEVEVLHASGTPSEGMEDLFVHGREAVPHRAIPHRGRRRIVRHPRAIGDALRPGDVLVLHEGWVTGNLVAAEVARRRRVPYIVVPHGVYEPGWRRYLRPPMLVRSRLERRALEAATAAHLFFDTEEPALRAVSPHVPTIVAATGHDIPVERWRGGGGYLAWVGRYDPVHKGLDILVDAIGLLPPAERPHVRLHGYDYRGGLGALRARIAAADLGTTIEVGGPIGGRAKRSFLLAADGYLLPSRWESHSLALLEILALGVPSVVSRQLHIAPLLTANGAARTPELAIEPLAEAVAELASGAAAETGARARDLVAREFAWPDAVRGFLTGLGRCGLDVRPASTAAIGATSGG